MNKRFFYADYDEAINCLFNVKDILQLSLTAIDQTQHSSQHTLGEMTSTTLNSFLLRSCVQTASTRKTTSLSMYISCRWAIIWNAHDRTINKSMVFGFVQRPQSKYEYD